MGRKRVMRINAELEWRQDASVSRPKPLELGQRLTARFSTRMLISNVIDNAAPELPPLSIDSYCRYDSRSNSPLLPHPHPH